MADKKLKKKDTSDIKKAPNLKNNSSQNDSNDACCGGECKCENNKNQDNKNCDKCIDHETEIKRLNETLEVMNNSHVRALADYKNLQKRTAEQQEQMIAYSNQVLIAQLLEILDNMQLMNNHLDDQGLKLVTKRFEQILNDEGLEEIETKEKEFDPIYMEAIEMIPGEKNKVIETVQKGYKLKDRLLRPAKVKVGLG